MWTLRPIHYLMVAPVHLLLLALIFVPALYVGWLSLTHSTFGGPPEFVGLANYVTLLGVYCGPVMRHPAAPLQWTPEVVAAYTAEMQRAATLNQPSTGV